MVTYVLRRLALAIPIAVVATFVVFLMVSFSGDPLADLKAATPPPSPRVIELEEQRLHLDQPLLVRYGNWLVGLPQGEFGPSVRTNVRIDEEILSRAAVTFRLVIGAFLLALLISVVIGVISAYRQRTYVDHGFSFAALLFLSMPTFWFAVLLKQAGISLNDLLGRDVVYTVGEGSIIPPTGLAERVVDIAGHMVLPTICLALVSIGAWSRFQRAAMVEVLNSDFIRLARSKGLSRNRVLFRHALRAALIPLVTVSSMDIAALVSGSVVMEKVFQWRGMGDFLVTSISQRDAYAVMSWLAVTAVTVVVLNLICDMVYGLLDPRIRYA